ncbi:unnamed protein product [Protopolystoma xenopodis]|uniref:G-protein coupled receptors family 1 profile domain-containing protein n=1 Tax=Protopolystoma xenopodis TaxID=117903 RepID=A0A3S5C4G3_9PLAT|nr:unnamed protein product [Protopolystoma xenopodis]
MLFLPFPNLDSSPFRDAYGFTHNSGWFITASLRLGSGLVVNIGTSTEAFVSRKPSSLETTEPKDFEVPSRSGGSGVVSGSASDSVDVHGPERTNTLEAGFVADKREELFLVVVNEASDSLNRLMVTAGSSGGNVSSGTTTSSGGHTNLTANATGQSAGAEALRPVLPDTATTLNCSAEPMWVGGPPAYQVVEFMRVLLILYLGLPVLLTGLITSLLSLGMFFRDRLTPRTTRIMLTTSAGLDFAFLLSAAFYLEFKTILSQYPSLHARRLYDAYEDYVIIFINYCELLRNWVIVLIGLERYIITCYPLHCKAWWSVRTTKIGIAVCAAFALLLRLPMLLRRIARKRTHLSSWWQLVHSESLRIHTLIDSICLTLLPVLILSFCSLQILRVMHTSTRLRSNHLLGGSGSNRGSISAGHKGEQIRLNRIRLANQIRAKVHKVLMIVLGTFTFCGLPFLPHIFFECYREWETFQAREKASCWSETSYNILTPVCWFCSMLNSTANFFVYIIYWDKYRQIFHTMLGCDRIRLCTKQERSGFCADSNTVAVGSLIGIGGRAGGNNFDNSSEPSAGVMSLRDSPACAGKAQGSQHVKHTLLYTVETHEINKDARLIFAESSPLNTFGVASNAGRQKVSNKGDFLHYLCANYAGKSSRPPSQMTHNHGFLTRMCKTLKCNCARSQIEPHFIVCNHGKQRKRFFHPQTSFRDGGSSQFLYWPNRGYFSLWRHCSDRRQARIPGIRQTFIASSPSKAVTTTRITAKRRHLQ